MERWAAMDMSFVFFISYRSMSLRTEMCIYMYWIIVYCTVLYCTALYCIVLYCTALYCTVLYCTLLYSTVLYCTVSYCTVSYCTVSYCTGLYDLLFLYLILSPRLVHFNLKLIFITKSITCSHIISLFFLIFFIWFNV